MAKRKDNPIGNLNSKIYQEEYQAGIEASAIATRYLRSKIRESGLILRGIGSPYKKGKKNKNERKPIIEATYVKPQMGTHRLLGLQFNSNRSGFVHHFGVTRDNTKFIRTFSKTGKVFEKKKGALDSQAFFDDIYKNSGALQKLEDSLAKTRTRAFSIELQNMALMINKENG